MDLTTRLHNNTARHLTVELLDQFNLRRGPPRHIQAGGSIDLGRRFGFSGANPHLRLHLRAVAETESRLLVTATIMPIDVFVNADIYLSSFVVPNTAGEMIRVNFRPAHRSINRLRLIRWGKDLKAYVGAICGSNPTSIVQA